jgi:hypothetical protein
MRYLRTKRRGLAFRVGLYAVALAAGLQMQAASAQDKPVATPTSAQPQTTTRAVYYVDFRARTAASYGHAFVWYGRVDQKQVEVAGVHPATESVVPYIIGHLIPVPAETGKSYGDLDEDYVTASYRVYMTEAEAKDVFAFIKRLESRSLVWNAATWNCVAFIQVVAIHMGLKVPGNHLLYPEDWVNQLRKLNGGRRYMSSPAVAQAQSKPASRVAASAQKPAAPASAQTAAAGY